MATEPTSFPAIEIFRAGTHTGDDGRAWTFSDADLRAIAAAYDPETSEAPIVIGHPATDAPAYGWVASVLFADGRLSITARDVEPQFAGMVRARRFSKRSAAFYTPEHPKQPQARPVVPAPRRLSRRAAARRQRVERNPFRGCHPGGFCRNHSTPTPQGASRA